jgi:hypothetical protein
MRKQKRPKRAVRASKTICCGLIAGAGDLDRDLMFRPKTVANIQKESIDAHCTKLTKNL